MGLELTTPEIKSHVLHRPSHRDAPGLAFKWGREKDEREILHIHMHSAAPAGDLGSVAATKVGPGSGTPLGSSAEETLRVDPVKSAISRTVYRIDRDVFVEKPGLQG